MLLQLLRLQIEKARQLLRLVRLLEPELLHQTDRLLGEEIAQGWVWGGVAACCGAA